MKFCGKCCSVMDDNATVCPKCGAEYLDNKNTLKTVKESSNSFSSNNAKTNNKMITYVKVALIVISMLMVVAVFIPWIEVVGRKYSWYQLELKDTFMNKAAGIILIILGVAALICTIFDLVVICDVCGGLAFAFWLKVLFDILDTHDRMLSNGFIKFHLGWFLLSFAVCAMVAVDVFWTYIIKKRK